MAGNDKFLADADKTSVATHPYKAHHFNAEPRLALTPLIFGGIATVLDLSWTQRTKKIAIVDDDAARARSLERPLNPGFRYSVRSSAGA